MQRGRGMSIRASSAGISGLLPREVFVPRPVSSRRQEEDNSMGLCVDCYANVEQTPARRSEERERGYREDVAGLTSSILGGSMANTFTWCGAAQYNTRNRTHI